MIKVNELIVRAMKAQDKIAVSVLRAIKTAFLNWNTAKENVGKIMTDVDEINILKKLKSQYEETAEACNDGKHVDLVKEAQAQANYIARFLPAPVTEDMIKECINNCGIEFEKKNMGNIIKYVKAKYPNADGKLVADIVGCYITRTIYNIS